MMVGMWNGTPVTGNAADLAQESATTGLCTAGRRRQAGGNHDPPAAGPRLGRGGHPRVTAAAHLDGHWRPACLRQPQRRDGLAVGFQAEAVVEGGSGALVVGCTLASERPMARPTAWSVRG
jgi:hypothetical protein